MRLDSATVNPGAIVSMPLDPEDATTLNLMVLSDQTVTAETDDGTELVQADFLDYPALGATVTSDTGAVHVTNPGTEPAEVGLVVTGDTALTLKVLGGGYAPAGSATSIQLETTLPDGTPVQVEIARSDGTVVASETVTVSSGTAAVTFTPDTPGVYEIHAGTGGPLRREVGYITAVDPAVTIGAATGFGRVDSNGDGLYEQLTVDVPISTDSGRDIRLVAQLTDHNGARLFGGVTTASLPTGGATVTLPFEASRLYDWQAGGPFTVRTVLAIDPATEQVLAFADNIGTSPSFDASLWQHDRVVIGEAFTDQGVDVDGDGDLDLLQVTGEVTVDTAATYAINARLVSSDDHTEIVQFQTQVSLPAGTSALELTFDGQAIGTAGIDGPYRVEDLSVYPLSAVDALGYRVVAHTTAPYLAADFDGWVPPVFEVTGFTAGCNSFTNPPTHGGSTSYWVSASWDQTPGAVSYSLHRQTIGNNGSPQGQPSVVWIGTSTAASDGTVREDRTYDYWATATDADGVVSLPSSVVRVTINCAGGVASLDTSP